MAVRATMADLITRVRLLINDPAGASQIFADQDIQDTCDRYQTVVRYAVLQRAPTLGPGGIVDKSAYRDYYAMVGYWESDETLYDAAYNTLAPDTSDRITGHWTFAAGQLPIVRIVGKVYDLYGAAADLLEAWAAKVALDFDFTTDAQTFRQSQKQAALLKLAA